jgi:hypothetical protein
VAYWRCILCLQSLKDGVSFPVSPHLSTLIIVLIVFYRH